MSATTGPTVGAARYGDGIAVIDGVSYRCKTLKQFHTMNEFSVAELVLIPGEQDSGLVMTILDIYDQISYVKKGADITVDFKIEEPGDPAFGKPKIDGVTYRVFTGKFLGTGPVWFRPSDLRITVWAIHPLGMLDWAATGLDALHGFGFDDYNLAITSSASEEIVPYMQGAYDKTEVTKDLWKNLIKPELIQLCRTNRFGTSNAEAVAKYLETEDNDKSPIPLALTIGDPGTVILDVRRTLMTSAPGRRSLWDNLAVLAGVYKFSVICRANDFIVVPAIPALGNGSPEIAGSSHYPLRCSRFHEHEEYNALARDISQSIGMLRGPGGVPSFFDVEARKRQEQTRVPVDETVVAATTFSMVPRFLDFGMTPFFNTGVSLGLKLNKLAAVGFKISPDTVSTETLNTQYNVMANNDLRVYADVVMNEQQYSGTTAVYKGFINWDICPGNTVQLEPPTFYQSSDTELDKLSFFGRVWSVATIIEPHSVHNGTYLIATHIRNNEEQDKIELEAHPMYDRRWVSAPLLTIGSFTEKMQYA